MDNVLQNQFFQQQLFSLQRPMPFRRWLKQTPADSKPTDEAKPETGLKNGYRLQEYDDIAIPIEAVVPRSAARFSLETTRLAWYMVGRLFDPDHRDETAKAATSAFRKAVKLDSEAIEIYRVLIPMEFSVNNVDDARRSIRQKSRAT